MPRLTAFIMLTLDGYFADAKSGLDWAHSAARDEEFDNFTKGNAGGGGRLVMGRTTYEMMVQYWPTPAAMKDDPEVARGMNDKPKIVFSKTLKTSSWNNTTIKRDLIADMRKLKSEPGEDLVTLGSGSLVTQLAQEGLIDEYQEVLFPVVLGKGKTIFAGLKRQLNLKLGTSRSFRNGNLLLSYTEARG